MQKLGGAVMSIVTQGKPEASHRSAQPTARDPIPRSEPMNKLLLMSAPTGDSV